MRARNALRAGCEWKNKKGRRLKVSCDAKFAASTFRKNPAANDVQRMGPGPHEHETLNKLVDGDACMQHFSHSLLLQDPWESPPAVPMTTIQLVSPWS